MEKIKRKLHLSKLLVLVVALLLVAGLVGGYFFYTNYQKSDDKNSTPAGWVEYKSEKYKLRFSHPESWGKPDVNEKIGDKGKQYVIGFNEYAGSPNGRQVGFELDTNDFERKVCHSSGECDVFTGLNKSRIETILSGDKSSLAKYDHISYAVVLTIPDQGLSSGVDYYQIISIHALNITAAHAFYYIPGSSDQCPQFKISEKTNNQCVSESDYNNVKKMVNSFTNL